MEAGLDIIGPYHVVRRLGAGGMAETYVAERRGPGGFLQRACLKCIRPDMAHDQEFVRQFLSEARILATLRHATIVQVLDFGQENGRYYLALELIEGGDLHVLLQQTGRLPPAMCLQLALDMASALEVAHQCGIVHRDVSPSNVLISRAGEVKLTDFGIAKSATTGRHTRTGVIKGKVPYMAPEYTQSGNYDPSCDLFALGVVLFESLAGKRPYDGATDIDTMARACLGRHEPLGLLAPHAQPELCRILERLVHPEPSQRPPSATELLEELLDLPHEPRARRDLGELVRNAIRTGTPPEGRPHLPAPRSSARARASGAAQATPFDPTVPLTTPTPAGAPTHVVNTAQRVPALEDFPDPPTPTWPPRRHGQGMRIASFSAAALLGSLAVFWVRDQQTAPAPPTTTGVTEPSGRVQAATEPAEKPTTAPAPTSPHPKEAEQAGAVPNGTLPPTAPTSNPNAPGTPPPRSMGAPHPEQAPARSQLTVVVIPYGDVKIDGKPYGQAPVTTRLTAGRHRIVADTATGRLTRTIRLAPGKRRKVVLQ